MHAPKSPRTQHRDHSLERGFTIIEMMVALVILGIAGGLVTLTFRSAVDARNVAMGRLDSMERGRSTLNYMTRELATATLNELGRLPNTTLGGGCVDLLFHPGTGGYPPSYYHPNQYDNYADASNKNQPDHSGRRTIVYDTVWDYQSNQWNGADNDGDDRVDEIQLRFTGYIGYRINDRDDDGDGLINEDGAYLLAPDGSLLLDPFGRPISDIGVDADRDGWIDEDGAYPADMVNFAITHGDSAGIYDIREVGYAIGTSLIGTDGQEYDFSNRLLRRYESRPAFLYGERIEGPIDGQFIDPNTGMDLNEYDFSAHYLEMMMGVADYPYDIDVLCFDCVGMQIDYLYFNYAVYTKLSQGGGDLQWIRNYRGVEIDVDGDGRAGEDPLNNMDWDFDGRIDEDPPVTIANEYHDLELMQGPWRSVRGNWESSAERYPNEPEDVMSLEAALTLDSNQMGICGPIYLNAIRHMDGLPDMVEITLFLRDNHSPEVRTIKSRIRISQR